LCVYCVVSAKRRMGGQGSREGLGDVYCRIRIDKILPPPLVLRCRVGEYVNGALRACVADS
jgi:hypothetical protein